MILNYSITNIPATTEIELSVCPINLGCNYSIDSLLTSEMHFRFETYVLQHRSGIWTNELKTVYLQSYDVTMNSNIPLPLAMYTILYLV